MKRAQPERKLQALVSKYLSMALPHDAFFTAIPGGDRQMTRTPGYRSGTPDMLVIHQGKPLFIELKSLRGKTSATQNQVGEELVDAGADSCVCRSLEHVEEYLRNWGIPLRASIGGGVGERKAA